MEIEKLFVSLALDAASYSDGLASARREGATWSQRMRQTIGGGLATAAAIGGAALLGVGLTVGSVAVGMANDVTAAAGDIQAQLGLTAEEARETALIAADVWGNNFAESAEDAAGALVIVRQNMQLADDELQNATENAFRLADAFEADIPQSVNSAAALMNEFGLSQQEAFDFITTGMQQGLNASDDFLDSIGEYSNLFSDAGFSADQMFNIMDSGMAAGVLGTDKISDAIKEYGIIMNEGTDDARAALSAMGLDYDQMAASVAAGDEAWGDYFTQIVDGINDIENPMARSQAQVAIFGTMAEDLGVSFTEGLTTAGTAMEDMRGSTASLDAQYNTLGDVVEVFRRRAIRALEPIGRVMLSLANRAMPLVEEGFAILMPVIEDLSAIVEGFFGGIEAGLSPLDAFIQAMQGIAPPEVMAVLTQFRDEILPGVVLWLNNLWTQIQPVVETVTTAVAQFVSWKDILIVVGALIAGVVLNAIIGIAAALAPVVLAVTAVIGVVALLRNAWENDWGGIRTALIDAWENNIQPAFVLLQAWLGENLPVAIEALRAFWVNVAWPAIQQALQIAWAVIQTIFNLYVQYITGIFIPTVQALWDYWVNVAWPAIQNAVEVVWPILRDIFEQISAFVINTLIPTIEDLYNKWVNVWWPEIRTALSNAWTAIRAIFEELGRWINDNIVPWVEFFYDKWVNVWWPAIQRALENANGVIGPAFDSMQGKMAPVKDAIERILDAAERFWNWLSSHTFTFDISLPDLPDWAIPGSPLPIHTAWKNFANDMHNTTIDPKFDPRGGATAAAMLALTGAAGSAGGGNSYRAETTINLPAGADPMRAIRSSRHMDKLGRGAKE